MQVFKPSSSRFQTLLPLILSALLGLTACGGGGSTATNTGNTNDGANTDAGGDDGNNNEQPNGDGGTGNNSTEYLDPINITTDLKPSDNDSGMEYELIGYRMHAGSIFAMDVLATNISSVVKSRGSCDADILKDDTLVDFSFSNFLNGAPLRPGDEMAATVFFRDVSDPAQVDEAVVNCNFSDLVTMGNDPSITHDFIEFTGPDTLGRIIVNIQIYNNSGQTIEFAYCDFSARNGNRIVENARFEFNFGREIAPGEAYLGEGILILDFEEFESDSFDPADLHCDYQQA